MNEQEMHLISDEYLVAKAKQGDQEAFDILCKRYHLLVKKSSYSYFLQGADRDDVWQEGMIGLYKAICDYQFEKNVPFFHFARLCITRQVVSAVKASTRQKHAILNSSLSFERKEKVDFSDGLSLVERFHLELDDSPEERFVNRENWHDFKSFLLETLTCLEYDVLRYYIDGWTYEEIANHLSVSLKSVDNALQRIKRKVTKRWLNDRGLAKQYYA